MSFCPASSGCFYGPAHCRTSSSPCSCGGDCLLGSRICMARRRYVALFGTPSRPPHDYRSPIPPMVIVASYGGRLGGRLHLHCRGTRSVRRESAVSLDRGPAVPPVLQVVSCLVQDLGPGDSGRKHLHVTAGWSDDFA